MAVNSITFGGVNSADFGIYISGEGVFNAPKRDVEMIAIPGRNGELALDKGRFENIEVTYPAFNFEPNDYETFAKNLSDFRNAICSLRGYQRLTDTFHPDEYRMAAYIGGLEIKPIKYNTASEFSIIFDCKPQRWLTSGEELVDVGEWINWETESGPIVEIEATETDAVKSLVADIEPIQDLHGYDKPWSGGNGKNKFPNSAVETQTQAGITIKSLGDGQYTIDGTETSGSTNVFPFDLVQTVVATNTQKLVLGGNWVGTISFLNANGGRIDYWSKGNSSVRVVTSLGNLVGASVSKVRFDIAPNSTHNNETAFVMLVDSSVTDNTFEPYSNICPISGRTECDTYVSPTTSETDAEVYTTALGTTVYGGTLDVTTGVLTVDRVSVDLGSLTWTLRSTGTNHKGWSSNLSQPYITTSAIAPMLNWIASDYSYIGGAAGSAIETGGADSYSVGVYHYLTTSGTSQTAFYTITDVKSRPSGQLVYELATPTTTTLTAQQIDLLLGTNNIWADTGDVTLEYGQNPNVIINPTLFESSPLLEVEGYGTIGFNGYEIELEDAELGTVTIANRSTTTTVTIPQGILNTGDTITVGKTEFSWLLTAINNYYFSKRLPTITDSNEAFSTVSARDTLQYPFVTSAEAVTFAYGSADSITNNVTVENVVLLKPDDTSTVLAVSGTQAISYDGDSTITFSHTATVSPSTNVIATADSRTHGEVTANSTVDMLGNPTYIDCDYGEAYKYESGTLASLNKYIDLGSDLPKLGVGQNEVTVDDTITELQIVPRWWKI